MFFSDIVGQQVVVQKLVNAFKSGRLGHATLFSGKEGYGGLPLSIALSRYIMCSDRHDNDACGECLSCKKFDHLVHPDLHFIFPVVNKKGKDPVSDSYINEWRSFITSNPYSTAVDWIRSIATENSKPTIYKDESDSINRKLSMKSFEGDNKIIIMWLPEKMNDVTSNKILKILEEPPLNTYFFLVSAQPEQILQTIISRTQVINLPPINNDSSAEYISNKYQIDIKKAVDLALFSEGNLAKAIELCDRIDELEQNVSNFNKFTSYCKNEQIDEVESFINQILDKGLNELIEFLGYIMHNVRHNVIATMTKQNNIKSDIPSHTNNLSLTLSQAQILYKELNNAIYHLERNVIPQLVMLDLALKIGKII